MARRGSWFRRTIGLFAAVLTAQAVWLLVSGWIRPDLPYFPDPGATEEASMGRSRAELAASIGWLRGDLWVEAATAASSALIYVPAQGREDRKQLATRDQARVLAEQAIRWAPHDARGWLLLAALDPRVSSPELFNWLKISYFTGPNEPELTPLRLRVATRASGPMDSDLQALVAKEIASVIQRRSEQTEALIAAYREASPAGKQFIEAILEKLDQSLLATLRSPTSR
jgi:hypothetical protein